jgi:HEAT repeat protein
MIRTNLLTASVVVALCATISPDAFAHGGTYRGPGDVLGPPDPGGPVTPPDDGDPPDTGGNPPTTPGGNPPTTPGGGPPPGGSPGRDPSARTGSGLQKRKNAGVEGFDTWQYWWEYNKDRFLDVRERLASGATTTDGGGYLLGNGLKSRAVISTRPSAAVIEQRIVPLLVSVLDESERDLVDSAVLALGRIVPRNSAASCIDEITSVLNSPDASVRQSAILSLGVLGSRDAVPTLVEILGDTEIGRKTLGLNGKIQEIERSFAAFAIGYIGAPDTIPVLVDGFERAESSQRSLRGSLLIALGLFTEGHQEIAQQLMTWLGDSRLEEDVAAQIPIALGRLGVTSAIPTLLKVVTSRKTRSRVEESAILALGALATVSDEEVIAALRDKIEDGENSQARHFAIIALADIAQRSLGADFEAASAPVAEIRHVLFRQLVKARRATHEPWAALALAIAGRGYPSGSKERSEIAWKIQEQFEVESIPSQRGAFAIALGILDATSAGSTIQDALLDSHDVVFRGFCAVALGMLRHAPARPVLRDLVKLDRDPRFRLQVATALGLMGDVEATALLVESFRTARTLNVIASLARAIGLIGDGRAVQPLEQLVADSGATPLARGFGCVALGLLAEKTNLPWNARISVGVNYRTQISALREVLDIL